MDKLLLITEQLGKSLIIPDKDASGDAGIHDSNDEGNKENIDSKTSDAEGAPDSLKVQTAKFNDELLSRFKVAFDKSSDPSASEEEEELKNDEDMKKVLENLRFVCLVISSVLTEAIKNVRRIRN